jgi:hypothetical protein
MVEGCDGSDLFTSWKPGSSKIDRQRERERERERERWRERNMPVLVELPLLPLLICPPGTGWCHSYSGFVFPPLMSLETLSEHPKVCFTNPLGMS